MKVDVADEDYEKALAVIAATVTSEEKESARSARARVSEPEREFKRGIIRFLVGAIPCGTIAYLVTPAPKLKHVLDLYERQPPDLRPLTAATGAVIGGLLVASWLNRKKPDPAQPALHKK